ncbi:hypothetical protein PXNS11_370002 [Stutzerimonas xanthomarina]|nr:hypothetical protein PXNS11_370002 [Stutzerimonas xanthomarina]
MVAMWQSDCLYGFASLCEMIEWEMGGSLSPGLGASIRERPERKPLNHMGN